MILRCYHADELGCFNHSVEALALACRELDLAVGSGKDGVVTAFFYVVSRMNSGTALFHDNHSRFNNFAVVNLYTQPLGLRISAEPCRTAGFLMGHM